MENKLYSYQREKEGERDRDRDRERGTQQKEIQKYLYPGAAETCIQ